MPQPPRLRFGDPAIGVLEFALAVCHQGISVMLKATCLSRRSSLVHPPLIQYCSGELTCYDRATW